MCRGSVACVEIQNVCPDDKFFEMARNSNWKVLMSPWSRLNVIQNDYLGGPYS